MKNKIIMLSSLAAVALLSGCASQAPMGAWYTNAILPAEVQDNAGGSKEGISTCKSYFNLILEGDASIATAKKNGGITKVTSVDWETKSILGVISEYKCIVRGE